VHVGKALERKHNDQGVGADPISPADQFSGPSDESRLPQCLPRIFEARRSLSHYQGFVHVSRIAVLIQLM
jgi:hypothetical protein